MTVRKKSAKASRKRAQRTKKISFKDHNNMQVWAAITIRGDHTHITLENKDGETEMLFEIDYKGITINTKDLPHVARQLVKAAGRLAKTDAEVGVANEIGIDVW